jgi:hypothetical protein
MAKPAEGMYKTKARNLSDAQLKRAKGLKASAKRTVSVSATKRITEGALKGKTVGAGGKPLTGTVVMANGDRAVYKAGKRVTNVPKKSLAPKGGGGGGGGGDTVNRSKVTTSRVSPQKRGEGSTTRGPGNRGATSSTVSSAISAAKAKDKTMTPAQRASRETSGYVRGSRGSQAQIDAMKGKGTLKENLRKKRMEDTRNQGRNALGIAGLAAAPFAAAGGAKLGGAFLAARLGTGAMQQGVSQGFQSGARYAAGQGAARGTMAAAKAGAKPKGRLITNKDIGATTRGINKKGEITRNGKPVTLGPRKPTAAQVATQRRQMAAKKAAATRRANSAKAEDARRASAAKAAATRRANAAKKKK